MSARWGTLTVWALVAASVLYWGLRVFVPAPAVPAHTRVAQPGAGVHGDLARLLGADAAPAVAEAAAEPAADARYTLVGVVSPRSRHAAGEGVAVIAVDGKPARAYRVGALVDGQNVLKSVAARSATLGPRNGTGEPVIALSLAPPSAAATGTLPSAALPGNTAPARPGAMPFTMGQPQRGGAAQQAPGDQGGAQPPRHDAPDLM